MVSITSIISYYNIIIIWDHSRVCGPSLTETSLCGAYLYSIRCSINASFLAVEAAQSLDAILQNQTLRCAVDSNSLTLGVGGFKYR